MYSLHFSLCFVANVVDLPFGFPDPRVINSLERNKRNATYSDYTKNAVRTNRHGTKRVLESPEQAAKRAGIGGVKRSRYSNQTNRANGVFPAQR